MAAGSSSSADKPLFSLFNTKRPAAPAPKPNYDATEPTQASSLASSSLVVDSDGFRNGGEAAIAAPQATSDKDGAVKGAGTSKGAGSSAGRGSGLQRATESTKQLKASPGFAESSSSPNQGSTSNGRVSSLPTSRSRTRSHSASDDEDDLVILSSKTSRPTPRKSKLQTKVGSRGSTRSSTPIITIPDSPPPRKSTSSFLPLSQLHRASREKRKANEPVEARWPTAEEHGGAAAGRREEHSVQSATRWQSTSSAAKGKGRALEQEGSTSVLEHMTAGLAIAELSSPTLRHPPRLHREPLTSVHSLLPDYPDHPLLHRIADPFKNQPPTRADFARPHDRSASASASELWTVKYAPKAASEVLGTASGRSARHLKDWLSELAILSSTESTGETHKRRRTVNRGAKHPRKKKKRGGGDSDLDDFIASDEDDEDGDISGGSAVDTESEDENGSSFRPAGGSSSNQRSVFRSLTNLILLVGPHGSGKTSAVHAMATEMDWSVFEVYPGIGKRGAKDVERYVGDVGKNHMVRAGGGPGSPRKSSNASNMFAMFNKPQVAEEPIPASTGPAATQSVILFDEVDMLYREEKDFWSGLISLAKQSRRPIVLTCTDIALIPFDDLGLQQVDQGADFSIPYLTFDAPEPEVVVPFLQLVALDQGHIIDPSDLAQLYQSTKPDQVDSWLLRGPADPLPHPFPTASPPSLDLRKALATLQFSCQWGVGDAAGGVGWMELSAQKDEQTLWSMGTLMKQISDDAPVSDVPVPLRPTMEDLEASAETLSFADSFVERRNIVLLDDHEPAVASSTADEEISLDVLPRPLTNARQLPTFGREAEMAEALFSCAPRPQRDHSDMIRQKQLAAVIDAATMVACRGLIASPAPILPNPAIFVEYLPFLRLITEAEDALAALEDDGSDGGRRGRRATRSTKAGYNRKLDWLPEEARLLRESAFELD